MPTRWAPRHLKPIMNKVFFKPWVGKDYDTGGMFGKKILVLGEAHLAKDVRTVAMSKMQRSARISRQPTALKSFSVEKRVLGPGHSTNSSVRS